LFGWSKEIKKKLLPYFARDIKVLGEMVFTSAKTLTAGAKNGNKDFSVFFI